MGYGLSGQINGPSEKGLIEKRLNEKYPNKKTPMKKAKKPTIPMLPNNSVTQG